MLIFFSSPPFYTNHVCLPKMGDPISPYIANNPKNFPFFKDCIGAIDGTHFPCHPTAKDPQAARDRKGQTTQNCLAICNFEMKFLYIFPGWEGLASDSVMFHDARVTDLPI